MSQGSAISFACDSSGSAAIAWNSGACWSKPRSRRPSAVARSKRKPSNPPSVIQRLSADSAMRDHRRAIEREAIAAARVVDVARRVVRQEAKIGGVVEAAERQRRTQFVAFAVVVEHDVEDEFEACGVQRVGGGAHFRPAPGARRGSGAPSTTGL